MSVDLNVVALFRDSAEAKEKLRARRLGEAEAAGDVGGCPTGAATAAAASFESEYPQTNRGTVTPVRGPAALKTGVKFKLDYLKLTIFSDQETVVELVREHLVDRLFADAPMENRGRRGRFDPVLELPGPLFVEVPLPEVVGRGQNYCMVHLQGDACDLYGTALVHGFLTALQASGVRWHCTRVDPCWDHVSFSPVDLLAVVDAGNFRSRMFDHRSFRFTRSNSQTLDTLPGSFLNPATGLEDKIRHQQNFRLYNLHGFNRFEWQFSTTYATGLLLDLIDRPIADWSFLAVTWVLKLIDFVDVSKATRVERCPRLSFWADFVGDAEKSSRPVTPKGPTKRELNAVQKMESLFARCGRQLSCVLEALGPDFVIGRLEKIAMMHGPDDRQYIASLQAFVGSGLCGVPAELPAGVEEIPVALLPPAVYDYLPHQRGHDELPF